MTQPLPAAPAGFTPEQWQTFSRDGLLHLPGALSPERADELLATAEQCLKDVRYDDAHTNKIENLFVRHKVFQQLIDHPAHIGYAYDLFGDQLRLSQNDLFARPPGSVVNQWHVDGPRAVPYRVFSPVLPLKFRVGFWLTDLPREDMGNLVYIPGSHRPEYTAEHAGTEDLPGQRALCCAKGDVTLFTGNLWHRIQPNTADVTRVNIFLSYTPSWINGYGFHNPDDFSGLTREQRIILRPYGDSQEDFSRPPSEDQPLYGGGTSAAASPDVERHKVRRPTRYERVLRQYDC